jgi:hypothetical protein
LISADSHFVEPPKMWAERLDARFRDRAPHAVKLEGKPGEYLACEDIAPAPLAAFFSAGVPAAEMPEFMKRGFDDAPKAVHDPAERLKDQDRDGVAAEVIYTSMGMPLFGARRCGVPRRLLSCLQRLGHRLLQLRSQASDSARPDYPRRHSRGRRRARAHQAQRHGRSYDLGRGAS